MIRVAFQLKLVSTLFLIGHGSKQTSSRYTNAYFILVTLLLNVFAHFLDTSIDTEQGFLPQNSHNATASKQIRMGDYKLEFLCVKLESCVVIFFFLLICAQLLFPI